MNEPHNAATRGISMRWFAGIVAMLCQLTAAAHLPALLAWLMAGALGAATLAATGEV